MKISIGTRVSDIDTGDLGTIKKIKQLKFLLPYFIEWDDGISCWCGKGDFNEI